MSLQVRWLIRRDMPEVMEIENASYLEAWSEEDFLRCLRHRNCIGMVAHYGDDHPVGFVIYELHKKRLHILKFAVAPAERRTGVGRMMVERLIDKLSQQRRREIVLHIRESNLSAQLFFRSHGFMAADIDKDYYEDEDAYEFLYDIRQSVWANRVSEYLA